MSEEEGFVVLKIVVVGDSGAGKTSLLRRLCDNDFDPTFAATVGIDFKLFTLPPRAERAGKIRLQIWDTAGQERFRAITKAYYRGAQGVMIVYAIDSVESFRNAEKWLEEVRNSISATTCITLVGTKVDLEDDARTVSKRDAAIWATERRLAHCEASSKTGYGVKECFVDMADRIQLPATPAAKRPEEENPAEAQVKKGCC